MAGKMLSRLTQIALALEAVEGTPESLADADATMLIYDEAYNPDIARFTRNPARSSLTPLAGVVGTQAAGINWRTELKGSGDVTKPPPWDAAIRACGFVRSEVGTIAIAAPVGGPFLPGEIVTGSVTGATGRVVSEISETPLKIVDLGTGTWDGSETATGSVSGATAATTGPLVAAQGFEYRPISIGAPSATVGLYQGGTTAVEGVKKTIYGARGNVSIESAVGEPGFLSFEFMGVYSPEVDALMLDPEYDLTIPGPSLDMAGHLMREGDPCFTNFGVAMANEVVANFCANHPQGITSFLITGRLPVLTADPTKDLVAVNDIWGEYIAQTPGRCYAQWGAGKGDGELVTVAAPRAVYSDIGSSDRNGILVSDITMELVVSDVQSAGDDEVIIAVT